ncbi:hypothetical protein BST63_16895 [Bradyrhizobium canariense]|uniref:DUF6894 domain-containing protein n=1 Tax=Bradyrhizobium canariense TaxID=255045 RepID=A0ABX3X2I1_9BRAD|nr:MULTISPECIES: hypothetical protein [Bradyrhizobium]OSJ14392.1 hypothetical protein BSR47_18920 [Bradyrhizobium canariense]OSJ28414.1 hypothetical protein BST63_16895 [Bradyrhizobium canariense]WOH55327.1 hypothetical protein RX329_23755 [Bradyrhizobium sp. BWC-3-1]
MLLCTYSISDLTEFESDLAPIILDRDEAQEFASVLAQEILAEMPELICKGMCIVVYDEDGNAIAHAPLGAWQ